MIIVNTNKKDPVTDSLSEERCAFIKDIKDFCCRSLSEKENAFRSLRIDGEGIDDYSVTLLVSLFEHLKAQPNGAWFHGSCAYSPYKDLENHGLVIFNEPNDKKSHYVRPTKELFKQLAVLRAPEQANTELAEIAVPTARPASESIRPFWPNGDILNRAIGTPGLH
ncbi:MAG: hypothetical protein WC521_04830 [Bdellovibrionales bacterium]